MIISQAKESLPLIPLAPSCSPHLFRASLHKRFFPWADWSSLTEWLRGPIQPKYPPSIQLAKFGNLFN
ncbi:MAG: hypothetical protein EBU26_08355 [Verrucomicrobia bacterium]|nr:hypothetical protein [Verrucomicrobiota bacterium]